MFSLQRVYAEAILPKGKSYTFWGRGVSQGHSDAIRRLDGVLDARQYTVPKEQYLEAIRNGETPDVDGYKGHLRECYVVAAPDADKAKIENEIKTMENYFVGYETVVNFISQEDLIATTKAFHMVASFFALVKVQMALVTLSSTL